MIEESYIYNGRVIHKRFKPKEHTFNYKVFSLLLDLDEIKKIDKEIPFFSYNKFNLISFHEKDHGDRNNNSLKEIGYKEIKIITYYKAAEYFAFFTQHLVYSLPLISLPR